jgi:hypothetical protein
VKTEFFVLKKENRGSNLFAYAAVFEIRSWSEEMRAFGIIEPT